MLKFIFTDIEDKEIGPLYPLNMTVNIEEDVPADDLRATFVYFESKELEKVRVLDEDTVVFTGVVDEFHRECDNSGCYIKVVCRSMAALLLDNESVPVSYLNPSMSVIASRHILPFSIKLKEQRNDTYFGPFTVFKGDSNWSAVESFSKKIYSTSPRVNELGEIDFRGWKKGEKVVFSNTSQGIKYLSVDENIKRCEEISRVRIKLTNSSGYHSVVENTDALNRHITRERYLNAVLTDTPAQYADKIIENSKNRAYVVTVTCMGQYMRVFGCDACVKRDELFDVDDLYVSGVRYQLSENKEITVLTLKRKEV